MTTENAVAGSAAPPRGFLQNLLDLYVSPSQAFRDIVAHPRVLAPMAVLLALNLAFTAVWLRNVEPREFMKAQIEQAGRWDKIPADRREDVLDQQSRMLPVFGWTGAILGAPIVIVVVGAVFLFVFRFFFAGELTFKQSLAVTGHAFLAVALVTTPLTLLTLWLKGDWTAAPQEALQANLAVLFDRTATAKPLYSLAHSLDLFAFWIMALQAIGYGIATRRSAGSAAAGIVGVYVIVVLVKVAWAAMF
jgi:hypothetical protein